MPSLPSCHTHITTTTTPPLQGLTQEHSQVLVAALLEAAAVYRERVEVLKVSGRDEEDEYLDEDDDEEPTVDSGGGLAVLLGLLGAGCWVLAGTACYCRACGADAGSAAVGVWPGCGVLAVGCG